MVEMNRMQLVFICQIIFCTFHYQQTNCRCRAPQSQTLRTKIPIQVVKLKEVSAKWVTAGDSGTWALSPPQQGPVAQFEHPLGRVNHQVLVTFQHLHTAPSLHQHRLFLSRPQEPKSTSASPARGMVGFAAKKPQQLPPEAQQALSFQPAQCQLIPQRSGSLRYQPPFLPLSKDTFPREKHPDLLGMLKASPRTQVKGSGMLLLYEY